MFSFLDVRAFDKGAKKYMILNIVLAFVGNILSLLAPLFVGFAVEDMVGQGQVLFDQVYINLLIAALLYFVGSILLWASNKSSYLYTMNVVSNLKNHVFGELLDANYKSLYGLQSGDIMMQLSLYMEMIYEAISYFLTFFIPGIVTIIFTIIMLVYLNYLFAITVLLMIPILYIYTKRSTRLLTKAFTETQRLSALISGQAEEVFSNHLLIQTFNYEKKVINDFVKNQNLYHEASFKSYFLSSLNNPSFRLITNISYLLLGTLFAVLNLNNIPVLVGTFTSILIYGSLFYRPVNELSNFTGHFILASTAYRNIKDTLWRLEPEKDGDLDGEIKLSGAVTFKDVDFQYVKDEELIKDFNLDVKPGMKIGIVGPTGAGKSTIINLLLRFYHVNGGEILLDGYNIKAYQKNNFRKQIGLILQEPWMFEGSIADNISYGKKLATREEIIEASKLAGSHKFIMKLKDGYDTIYENKGMMSVGQKQLITIARAILMNPAILILDEATSHIDSLMEKEISDAFKKVMQGKTTFMIAHRLKTIMDSDQIIMMSDGKIIEQGTHNELMALNGAYKELFEAQF